MSLAAEKHQERLTDARWAVDNACGYADLADLWAVSRPAAWVWCQKYMTEDDCSKIAENGIRQQLKPRRFDENFAAYRVGDRLELIAMCRAAQWPDAKIARAIGIEPSALSNWIKNNAPEGVTEALSDFTDEPEQAAA